MIYKIEIKKAAQRNLLSLPKPITRKIDAIICKLAHEPRPEGCKKLSGHDSLYRIRIGNYRVVYEIQDDVLIITIIRVAHRRDVYRGL